MPIYEYRCEKCGYEFETMQKVSEAPLQTCPQCTEDALRKKISPAGFRLKGGGWYETDFKGGKKKNVAGEQSSGDGGSAEKGAAAKPESGSASAGASSKSSDSGAGSSVGGAAAKAKE